MLVQSRLEKKKKKRGDQEKILSPQTNPIQGKKPSNLEYCLHSCPQYCYLYLWNPIPRNILPCLTPNEISLQPKLPVDLSQILTVRNKKKKKERNQTSYKVSF